VASAQQKQLGQGSAIDLPLPERGGAKGEGEYWSRRHEL